VSELSGERVEQVIAALDRMSGTLKLRVWNMSRHLGAWLEAGMVDMAIGTFEHLPKRIVAQPLFEHDYVWIARQGHPTASALRSVEDVLSLPRVEMDAGEGPVSSTGVWSEGGITRRAAADAHALLPTPAGPSDPSAVRLHLHPGLRPVYSQLAMVGGFDLVALFIATVIGSTPVILVTGGLASVLLGPAFWLMTGRLLTAEP